jgi:hypothetical protein
MSHKKQGFACVPGNSQAILTGSEKGKVLPAAAGSPMRGRPATPANLHPTFDLVLNYLTSSRKSPSTVTGVKVYNISDHSG